MNKIKLLSLSAIIGLSATVSQAKDSKEFQFGISITYTNEAGEKLSTTDDAQKTRLSHMASQPNSLAYCLRGLADADAAVKDKWRKKQTEDIEIVISEANLKRGTNDENRHTLPGISIHLENHFVDKDLLDQMKVNEFVRPIELATQSLSLDDMQSKCEALGKDLLDRGFNFRENVDNQEKEELKKIQKIEKRFQAVR